MQRRDFVKAMMAASVAAAPGFGQQAVTPVAPAAPPPTPTAPGPLPWMRGLLEAKPLPVTSIVPDAVADASVNFFSPQQFATLRQFCAMLMPPLKGYPGAIEAGTPEFLDFLIGASPADTQSLYTSGLDRLEAEAKHRFGKSFAQIETAQADQLIRPWLRTWMSDHPPTEPYAHFINVAHSDLRTATINSKAWSEAANAAGGRPPDVGLYWFPVDPDLQQGRATVGREPRRRNS